MIGPLGMAGLNVAGQAINTGMGLLVNKIENRQQLEQATKLQEMQIEGQKEMGDFNQGLALETWHKTNYEAQRKHMENAGLNVGLMYGQGGGGGATTSTPIGQVQGQSTNYGNIAGMAMNSKLGLDMATAQLLKAQTDKTKVETEKIAGVDTESIVQDIQAKRIANKINEATTWDQVTQINQEARKSIYEADIKYLEGEVLDQTQREQMDTIRKESILKGIEIKSMQLNMQMTKLEMQETQHKIYKIIEEMERMNVQNKQGWELLVLERMQKEFNTSTPAQVKQWSEIGVDLMKMIGTNNK